MTTTEVAISFDIYMLKRAQILVAPSVMMDMLVVNTLTLALATFIPKSWLTLRNIHRIFTVRSVMRSGAGPEGGNKNTRWILRTAMT
ncbi:hypothetical protein O9929_00310 [Vibrio lentus]|nr:hypothetical protein [Vibrio lentus]